MKAKLIYKVIIAITIPVVFQLGFFWFLLQSARELDELERAGRKATEILFLRDQLYVSMSSRLLSVGIFRATQKSEYKKRFFDSQATDDVVLKRLLDIWKDDAVKVHILKNLWNAQKQGNLLTLYLLTEPYQQKLSDILGLPITEPVIEAYLVQRDDGVLAHMFAQVEQDQRNLALESQAKSAQLNHQLILVLLVTSLVSIGCGLIFSQTVVVRLRKVVENIRSMESQEPPACSLGGSDEIALLNKAVFETSEQIRQQEEFQAQTARLIAQELEGPIDLLSSSMDELRASGFETMTENGKERIERTLLEINRLRILVRDLASLDKICRAGWDLNIGSVDLAQVAAEAVDTVQDFARSVNVEIVCKNAEARVIGDPVRLQQIALNLLTNAIKFSRAHTTIEVETSVEGKFGKLSVTDHGMGIPEDFQQYIFGKFEQVSRTDSTEKGGSGLGLAISKKLVESQDGRMAFRSKLGEGSAFWLMLPMEKDLSQLPSESKTSLPLRLAETKAPLFSPTELSTSSKSVKHFRPTLWVSGVLLVSLPVVVQAATIASLWIVIGTTRHNVDEFNRVSLITTCHSRLINSAIRGVFHSMLYNIEQEARFRTGALHQRRLVENLVEKLKELAQSDEDWASSTNEVSKVVNEYAELQDEIMNAEPDSNSERWFGAHTHTGIERKINQLTFPLQKAIVRQNELLERNMIAKMELRKSVEQVIIASALASFAVSLLLGLFMTRRLTSRVQRIVSNTERLSGKQPLEEPYPGADEVAFVDYSFFEAGNRLIQLERFKQEIIAITSHEFRTPLSSLLAKADLMHAGVFGELNKKGQEILKDVRWSISDLIVVITNLLDAEKIQSGKTIVAKKEIPLGSILNDLIQKNSQLAEDKNILIDCEGCYDPDLIVSADSLRLTQALTAALADIVSHAPPGSSILLNAESADNEAKLTLAAPRGECSRLSLNYATARGRLALNFLNLIAEQHGGLVEVNSSDENLKLSLTLPRV